MLASDFGMMCTTVCADAGFGCEDGDWEVHDEASLRSAVAAAGADWAAVCRDYGSAYNAQFNPVAGYLYSDYGTRFNPDATINCNARSTANGHGGTPAGISTCDDSTPTARRLCRCT